MSGRVSPTVLVASEDPALLDEIVRHLDQIPHWRLAASARSARELLEAIASHSPEAILVSDGLARDLALVRSAANIGSARVVVIGRDEHPATLRAALHLGARGFVHWPREQKELRALVEEGLTSSPRPGARGSLAMLWGPKGGSGTSVLAAHLTAALSSFGVDCVLVDLDLDHGDQSTILGAGTETKTFADLLRLVEELNPAVLESVAWRHPGGFRVILAPGSPGESSLVKGTEAVRVLGAIRETAAHVVVDLPSGFTELVYSVAEEASRIFLVVTPDLLALRRAREAMQLLDSSGTDAGRIEIILNRSRSGDISVSDVETVLGRPTVAQVPPDVGLLRAPDRGEISSSGRRFLEAVARRTIGLPEQQRRGLRRVFSR